MKRYLLAAALCAATVGGAAASSPTAAQLDQFNRICLSNGGSATVCSCKTQAAPRLVDSAFMAVVLDSMQGKALDAAHAGQYMRYIAQSNAACNSY